MCAAWVSRDFTPAGTVIWPLQAVRNDSADSIGDPMTPDPNVKRFPIPPRLVRALVATFLAASLMAVTLPATAGKKAEPEAEVVLPADFTPAAPADSADQVRAAFDRRIASIRSISFKVTISSKRKKRPPDRDLQVGTVEVVRGYGARAVLLEDDKMDEYVVNPETIWSIDHHRKEAQFIPTSIPVFGRYVRGGVALDYQLAFKDDSMRLLGSQPVDGEPCWILQAKTTDAFETFGLESYRVRIWISKNDSLPRKVQIPKSKDTIVTLTDLRVNGDIPRSRCDWSPPAGMKTKNIFGF